MKREERIFRDTDIAIVGMNGRMPQANDLNEFWQNLINGRECITRKGEEDGKFIYAQGLMDGAEYFDHAFFNVNASDALHIDPQYRCILECAYHTLEDAGYGNPDRDCSIGLFIGADETFYVWNHVFEKLLKNESVDRIGMFLENTLASRIAYNLNLTGPAVVVRAACATSMVAVHMAIESLLNFDCNMALAGGVNIKWLESGYPIVEGMSSAYGQLRAYDAMGDGFVPGNGLGLVALKRLDDAIESNDHIYAVITGSAVVNDGNRKAGYHASSVEGEAEAIIRAMETAERFPEDICCIEGHGTATPLGDSVEIRAIDKAYQYIKEGDYSCILGSVKSNIGHLNTAAGIAGIMKSVLALNHGYFPPSVNYDSPNPELLKVSGRLTVTDQAYQLPDDKLNIIGVSSFGFGGVNGHIILEEPPMEEPVKNKNPFYIIPVTAKTDGSLAANQKNIRQFILEHPDEIEKISYVSWTGREHFSCRAFFICSGRGEILYEFDSRKELKRDGFEQADGEALRDAVSVAEAWLAGRFHDGKTLFKDVPYKISLPVYAFERHTFFMPQLDLKNRKTPIGIVDAFSDSRFELTKYLAKQKNMALTVFEKKKEPEKPIEWIKPKNFLQVITELENDYIRKEQLHFLHRDPEAEEQINQMCLLCLKRFWLQTGVFEEKTTRNLSQVLEEIGVDAYFTHFVTFIMEASQKYGLVEIDEETIRLKNEMEQDIEPLIQDKLAQIKADLPDGYGLMKLLVYCSEHYMEVFQGEKTGSEVLYPNGSYDMLKGIEQNGTAEGIYCKLAADMVDKLMPECEQTIRILEIGAGTGELTDQVLSRIGNRKIKYYFTDIGAAFLAIYKKKLSADLLEKVEFLKVDITRPLVEQKIGRESIDMILGVNVIQATNDIKLSMNNLLDILKPNGYLCMVQLYRIHDLQEMIFGLSPGWWNYREDSYNRRMPYFTHQGWIDFWRECGIEQIETFPQKGKEDQSNAMLLIGQKPKTEGGLSEKSAYVSEGISERKQELLRKNNDIKICEVADYSKGSIQKMKEDWEKQYPKAELLLPEGYEEQAEEEENGSISAQLRKIISDILNMPDISPHFIEEFDSLSLLLLIAEIEKEFGYKIEIEQMYQFSDIHELAAEIQDHSGKEKTEQSEELITEEGDIRLLFEEL
ncbi:beta-ketoacyl synthase N-terminal-like domain-containing protein [Clostridium aminobutyricum]|uniref:Methyltransferase n=1 Tax=Clostridium aminobutyricum TaxID=33953 RepID=A0A939D9K0_CLOAM|nr:beta-ketoacyl synthase N-terminal-like domain-containing protein [Clostridium aminobutyricum]MBN7773934.1 methyltransferase [Clostridium aminobutyricum]